MMQTDGGGALQGADARRPAVGAGPGKAVVLCGALVMDTLAGRAYHAGKDLLLTPKEFFLLRLLAETPGRAYTGEELYQTLYGQPAQQDVRAIKTLVYRLRKKIAPHGYRISSRRGSGYRFEQPPPA